VISCWPGSAPGQTAPSSSEARAPVEIQNATSARSRLEGSLANSSLNASSGICFGTRRGTRGRNKPAFCFGNGFIGLWWEFARSGRASGNGSRAGRSRPPGDSRRTPGRPFRSARPSTARTSPTRAVSPAPARPLPAGAGACRRSGDAGRSRGPQPCLVPRDVHGPGEPEPPQQRQRVRPLGCRRPPGCLQVPQELRYRLHALATGTAQEVRLPQVPGLDQRPGRGHRERPEVPDSIVLLSHEQRP
jgi:hypothetical protein